jgi:hypothetical protein
VTRAGNLENAIVNCYLTYAYYDMQGVSGVTRKNVLLPLTHLSSFLFYFSRYLEHLACKQAYYYN